MTRHILCSDQASDALWQLRRLTIQPDVTLPFRRLRNRAAIADFLSLPKDGRPPEMRAA